MPRVWPKPVFVYALRLDWWTVAIWKERGVLLKFCSVRIRTLFADVHLLTQFRFKIEHVKSYVLRFLFEYRSQKSVFTKGKYWNTRLFSIILQRRATDKIQLCYYVFILRAMYKNVQADLWKEVLSKQSVKDRVQILLQVVLEEKLREVPAC